MKQIALPPARGSRAVEVVDSGDTRIGREWHTYVEIAERRGQSPGSVAIIVRRVGVRPVGVIRGRGGRALFDERDLVVAGVWPERPIDHAAECWLSEYADRRGLPKAHAEDILRSRLAQRLGVSSPAAVDVLAREGIARRFGNRWVVNIAAADALLNSSYDPAEEATARELIADIAGYTSPGRLAEALKRGGVPSRAITAGGRRVLLFQCSEAYKWASGRYVPMPRAAREAPPQAALLRSSVGPIGLRAPTSATVVGAADAAWLLGMESKGVRSALPDCQGLRGEGSGVSIAWLEEELTRAEDFEGFLLLAGMVDGVFCPRPSEDRTAAVLRLLEKTGQSR